MSDVRYSFDSLVVLKRLSGQTGLVLAQQLLSAAEAEKQRLEASGQTWPLRLEWPRARMEVAYERLEADLRPEAVVSAEAREADKVLDQNWRALSSWLEGLLSWPEGTLPEKEKVEALHALLFQEGLTFINASWPEEWASSESRLNALIDGGYQTLLESLGGKSLLDSLRSSHQRYGEVLGITAPVKSVESPTLRQHLLELIHAIKEYVVKALAYDEQEESGSGEIAKALLAPVQVS